jgi:hypothetical protein
MAGAPRKMGCEGGMGPEAILFSEQYRVGDRTANVIAGK